MSTTAWLLIAIITLGIVLYGMICGVLGWIIRDIQDAPGGVEPRERSDDA